jgi:hypothetical protein
MSILAIVLLLIVGSFFWPVIRFFLSLALLVVVISVFTDSGSGTTSVQPASSSSTIPSYKELENYPVSCDKKEAQLTDLHRIQNAKHFSQDPDSLNDYDRAYNSKLKATIWWFSYGCQK